MRQCRFHLVADQIDDHFVEQLLDERSAGFSDHGAENGTVSGNMLDGLAAESEQALVGTGVLRERLALLLAQGRSKVVESAEQEILFVVEVRVKSSAAYIGAIEDVLHRERLEAFFLDQIKHGLVEELEGALDPAIGFGRTHIVYFPNMRRLFVR